MSSDFESYEQDFAVLTAEITGRIGKVPKLVGGKNTVHPGPENNILLLEWEMHHELMKL